MRVARNRQHVGHPSEKLLLLLYSDVCAAGDARPPLPADQFVLIQLLQREPHLVLLNFAQHPSEHFVLTLVWPMELNSIGVSCPGRYMPRSDIPKLPPVSSYHDHAMFVRCETKSCHKVTAPTLYLRNLVHDDKDVHAQRTFSSKPKAL